MSQNATPKHIDRKRCHLDLSPKNICRAFLSKNKLSKSVSKLKSINMEKKTNKNDPK